MIQGSLVAIVTPMHADGSVDAAAWIPLADIDAIPHLGLVDFARAAAGDDPEPAPS